MRSGEPVPKASMLGSDHVSPHPNTTANNLSETSTLRPLRVSFHVFPHMMSNGPLPALGYLKAYAESRMETLEIRPVYWSTACIRVFRQLHLLPPGQSSIEGNSTAQSLFDDLFVALALSRGENQDERKLAEILDACTLTVEPTKGPKPSKISPTAFLAKFSAWVESKAREFGCFDDDIIACSFGSIQALQSLVFLSYMRKRNPNAWFVVGGLTEQQAGLLMDAAPFVDIAVFGEGEETLLELCRARIEKTPRESIRGIVFRREGSVTANAARESCGEIHGLWADYRGFDWEFAAEGGADVDLPIWDSRNCWWGRCEFCDFMRTQPKFSERDPDDIKAEIEYQIGRHPEIAGIRTRVMFLGLEACGSDSSRLLRILDDLVELKRSSLPRMRTFFELSPRNSDRRIMQRMNELNPLVQWGFEQVNSSLELCNKSHRIESIIHTLKLASRFSNIRISGFNLLISVPGDSCKNCLQMRDNLWLLRFILSVLSNQKQMLQFRPLQIDVSEGIPFGGMLDFSSPWIRENLRRTPWVHRYSCLIGDEEKAIDFGTTLQLTPFPDTSLTRDKYVSVIEEFSATIGSHSIRVYEDREGRPVIAMTEEGTTTDLTVSEEDHVVLVETASPRKFKDLELKLDGRRGSTLAEIFERLTAHGLIWLDPKRRICINTLPPQVQDTLDLKLISGGVRHSAG